MEKLKGKTFTRSISLPAGGTLEVEMTQAFIDKCRQHFGLLASQPVEDDHVRMFFYGSLKEAVDKEDTK